MSHEHHSHAHDTVSPSQSRVRLAVSLFITLAFVGVEAMAGYLANSLALITDAAHNLTDAAALGLSWYALNMGAKPAHAGKTFGYHRVGILAALVNSSTLVLMAAGIGYEAWQRFDSPSPVSANLLMGVGSVALVVNVFTAWLVSHGKEHDINMHAAFLHLMGDVVSTLGAILAGVGIYFTGLNWLDPLASVLIGLLIVWNAWTILRETLDILMENTPRDIEMSGLVRDLMKLEGVQGVHDLHVWSLSRNLRFLSAHVVVEDRPVSDTATLREQMSELVEQAYRINHVTLQFESLPCCPDALYCNAGHAPH